MIIPVIVPAAKTLVRPSDPTAGGLIIGTAERTERRSPEILIKALQTISRNTSGWRSATMNRVRTARKTGTDPEVSPRRFPK